jgi:carbonic anhydrase/acetyltransferase-like protein (isoleucine patch superfamily)
LLVPIYALGDVEPDIDEAAFVHPDAVVIGRVRIGPEASVWPCAVLRGDHGWIEVGARTSIQDGTVVHCTRDWPTVIGSECVVGHNAHLEGCVVEDRCLIGSGSVILNRAVGVPATIKRTGVSGELAARNMNTYLASARRYRSELRRLSPPGP